MTSTPEIERKVRQLDNDVQSIYELLHAIQGTQTRHGNRLAEIGDQLLAHDRRFDALEVRLDGMDQRFDGMDQRFDGMDQRLDGMDQRLDGLQGSVTQILEIVRSR